MPLGLSELGLPTWGHAFSAALEIVALSHLSPDHALMRDSDERLCRVKKRRERSPGAWLVPRRNPAVVRPGTVKCLDPSGKFIMPLVQRRKLEHRKRKGICRDDTAGEGLSKS